MSNPTKQTQSKRKPALKADTKKTQPALGVMGRFKRGVATIKRRVSGLLGRRSHRSFRVTRRRDYVRSLQLPGYWSFTNYVRLTLVRQKRLFLYLILFYGVLSLLLVGLTSQESYATLGETIKEASSDVFAGNMAEVGRASVLFVASVTGSYGTPLSTTQQVYALVIISLTWLTSVWLLRAVLAGGTPKLRDGLYNAGAPIVSTAGVGLVMLVQLIPAALAAVGFAAAAPVGLLEGGIEAMVFWAAAGALGGLSLYWITSTMLALVVVTLPGMYPLKAIAISGDLVAGRRLRILFRLVWLVVVSALGWAVIMIPVILLDAWLKAIFPAISWLPIVPFSVLIMSSITVVWSASYVYLLYRKVVDDDSAPV
jgi:hypothetical protein